MKKVLLPALESCNDKVVTGDEQSIEAILLTLMEDEQEANAIADDIKEKHGDMDEIKAAVERLEALYEVIEKYGISRPMMEAVDPHHELVAAGICCSYEELNEISTKDDKAEFAIQELSRVIDSSYASMEGIGDATLKKIKAWFENKLSIFVRDAKNLKDAKERLRGFVIDEEKFSNHKINGFTLDEVNKLHRLTMHYGQFINLSQIKALITLSVKFLEAEKISEQELVDYSNKVNSYYKHLRTIDKETQTTLGVKIDSDDSVYDPPYMYSSDGPQYTKGTIKELGFSSSDIDKMFGVVDDIQKLYMQINEGAEDWVYEIRPLSHFQSKKDGTDDEKRFRQLQRISNGFISTIYFISEDVWYIFSSLYQQSLAVANAALKSKQH